MNILETLIRLRDDIKTWVTNNLVALDEKIESKTIPIDGELNENSTNPVQNKVIAEEINKISDAISNIADDGSDNFSIADPNGNIVFKAGAEGIHTTNVNAKTVSLDGEDLGVRLDELESISLPNILDNESGDLIIADESGNSIVKIDANGLETTTVTADSAVINGVDVAPKLDELDRVSDDLTTHASNTDIHITSDERSLWNNKSDFSGNYNDLQDAPNITEDESGEVIYADESGNVIAKINEAGLETTQVMANTVVASGVDLGSTVSSHVGNNDIHITEAERNSWNAKATTTYVDEKVAGMVDSAPETLNTLNELAAALGDDPNFATTVAEQIGSKANQTDLNSHASNQSNPHKVTKAQVGLGNVDNTSDADKPVSFAQQAALDELKESIVSESKEWIVADNDGNIVARVDENGLETTTVTSDTVVVNGIDVEAALANKSENGHKHTVANITDLTATATELNYMDGVTSNVQAQLDAKSNEGHTHTITASASDDDVIVLTGTNGTNKVTYSASHATSGVTAGTYKSVTVNKYGHVTSGTNPTTLNDYGITDATSKSDFDGHTANKSNPHKVTKAQVGLGNVDNTSDADKPVSNAQQEALNALKTELSEAIVSESKEWTVADNNGNIVMTVDADGLETTVVTAKSMVVNGTDVSTKFDEISTDIVTLNADEKTVGSVAKKIADAITEANLSQYTTDTDLFAHTSNTELHVTKGLQDKWNGYESTISGHTTSIDKLDSLVGTTSVQSQISTAISNENLSQYATDEDLDNHINDTVKHITAAERTSWNAKATTTYVDEAVANIVNSAPDKLNTLDELAAALGDDANFATTVTNSLATKAAKTDLESHTGNTTVHITSAERTAWNAKATTNYVDEKVDSHASNTTSHITATERSQWNAKSNFSGDYNDLINAPDIKEDGSGNLVIADDDGNIIFRSDGDGFETTTLTAKNVVINGADVMTALDSHADNTIKHITSTERSNWNAAKSHADSAHAPSNAEKNQNAFSNVKVGSTTIAADTTTDTLTFVAGSNVTLTPDANGDSITIAATDTVYTHPASHPVSMITGLSAVATSGSYNDLTDKPNAFSNIKVGSTTVAADTATDTVTFAGSNVTITPDATNDKITFKVADATTDAKGVVQLVDSTNNTATDKAATANAVNKAYTLAGTANNTANSAKTTAESKSTVTSSTTNGNIKIDGTETTVYTHPTTAGNKHIPTGGSNGQVLKWSASGTATWGTDANTTYTFGTGDNNGTIKVTPSGGSAQNIAVKGLGTAAYTDSTAYAASNHTHTNVQPVSMTGDILAWAVNSAPMGLTPIYTGTSTTNTPSSAYTYSNGYVLKRTSSETTVVLFSYTDATMAANHYVNSAWKGWSIAATQDYVRDAISDIGSSTASGMVCEFDSGDINLTMSGSAYTNSKDSKSRWYWIWAYNSTLGGYMGFHVDWKALTSGGQPIYCGSNTTTHFGITVSKNSSNKLVVSVPNSATTVKRVVGYY